MAALRILVTGATGFLGAHVVAAVRAAGHVACTTGRSGGDVAVDLLSPGVVGAVCEALSPDVVLNLAAMSRVADCERDPPRAARVNAWLPEQWAARFGARLLQVSTDLVFDGHSAPYAPAAVPAPLCVYGASKAEGEQRVRAHGGRVVRVPLLFGPDAQGRGASASLRALLQRGELPALFTNEYRSPLHAADAAAALVELVVDPTSPSLSHLAGPERVSRWQLGQRLCLLHGLDASRLRAVECADPLRPGDVCLLPTWPARRSLDAMLASA